MSGAELTAEFREGAKAAAAGGDRGRCPYYATSNAADAWHAGFECERRYHLDGIAVEKVTKGRGYLLNVFGAADRFVAGVNWNAPTADRAPLVTFDEWQEWSPAMKAAERRPSERDRQLLELGAAAPLQSKGKAVADAGALPLFIAANEPTLF